MPIVGLRQLGRETKEVLDRLEADGEPVLITRHGRPIAALSAISEEQAAALAFAVVPEFIESRSRAAEAIAAGEGTPASELLAEFGPEAAELTEVALADVHELVLPASIVELGVGVASRAVPISVADEEEIQTLNSELVDLVVRDSLFWAFERVRLLNERISAEIEKGGSGRVTVHAYADRLRGVADVERLASRSTDEK